MGTICHNVTREDTEIAVRLGYDPQTKKGEFSPYRIATLRGLYDTSHPDSPLDLSNVDEAANTISSYRNQLKAETAKRVRSAGSHLHSVYRNLKNAFTAEERTNRVNMVATMVSTWLDNAQKNNPGRSRREFLEGYTDEQGRKVAGEFLIFDRIYNELLNRMYNYAAMEHGVGMTKAEKIARVLENWDGIVAFTRVRLRETEGIKLGNTMEYAADATLDNLDENQLSDIVDAEESKRDHWQETEEMKSAFASIGARTRAILGMTPECEFARDVHGDMIVVNGRPRITIKRDDLDFPIMGNPVARHQQMLDLLRGMVDSRDMMRKLKESAKTIPWITPVVSYLENNPREITGFYTDFKKVFQEMSKIEVDPKAKRASGSLKYSTTRLNRVKDVLTQPFKLRISNGKLLAGNSVYDANGNVNWDNLRKVRETVMQWLKEPEVKEGNAFEKANARNNTGNKYFSPGGTQLQRRDFIVSVSRALGLDMDADAAASLMSNSSDLRAYLKNLLEFFTYGVDNTITKSELEKWLSGKNPSDKKYSKIATANSGKLTKSLEKVKNMNELITKHREGLRVENRVPWRDSRGNSISLFSSIAPSYMASKFEVIQSYVENNDKKGLKQFLTNNYLESSFFMDQETGKIYNKWLEDLYNACDEKNPPLSVTVGGLFYYKRLLGTPEVNFEDFTSKQHAIDFLYEYVSDQETNQGMKEKSGLYPIFILGDSGTQKFVRQRRYTFDQIVNFMYDVYLQEMQRKKLVRATNQYLEIEGSSNNAIVDADGFEVAPGEGYLPIANYSETGNEFTTLTFLNDERYKLDDEPTEDEVKRVIRNYLNRACMEFKDNLEKLGVLETKKVKGHDGKEETVYVHLEQFMHGKSLDDALLDYFANTKFATIEQLQIMTIDPGFYGKEVTITNPNTGEKRTVIRDRTKDLQKRYKEIHAPGNELDIYAIDPETKELISPDATEKCIYFDDIEIDSENVHEEFMQLMKKLYGENSGIYKKYKANSLTDGQGYRSLSSYRKVMVMYDTQWTEEMESAYKEIMSIRAAYGKEELPKEALERLEKLAVVFKPIKPYMFTHEKIVLNYEGDTQFVPVQHKYAEAVLIPELLPKGSKLRDMGYYMEEHGIDMIGSTAICKVGAYGSTRIDHLDQYDKGITAQREAIGDGNKTITDTDRLNHALSRAKVHKLSYADYRIQTNVPNHVHQAQLFGTQVRKLIMAGTIRYDKSGHLIEPVDRNGHYRYEKYVGFNKVNLGDGNHVRMTGRNLNAFYNSLIVANQLESFNKFQRTILNMDGLSEKFIQNVIGNSRESLDNIMAFSLEDGDFAMPLFEGGLEHDSAAFLLSLFKKMVNKQLINGGSAVQVSAMGIQDYSEDGGLNFVYEYEKDDQGNYIIDEKTGNKIPSNILYIETEIPFDFSYVDEFGNTVELNYDDYCNADGTLKMDGNQSLLERDFPGITNIVAYRIPTERDYSMLNLKVVRCSRKSAGGTIKVPLECTTISGFDFDIDKLYFMRKEFVENKPIWQNLDLSQDQRQRIARQIQKDHPEFVKEIPAVTEESFTQSQLYDIFGVIYGDDPDFEGDKRIKDALKRARPEGDKTPLNRFWEDSPEIERMAKRKGFESAAAYKEFLVKDAAEKLGYLPEKISTLKEGYLALDKDAITKAGFKTGQVYREAADKLGIQLSKNVNEERFIEYNYDKTPLENDRVARNNMLLNLIQQRLMDPETLRSRTTPGGFPGASKSARIMRELNFGNLSGIEKNGKIDWDAMDKRASDKNTDPEPDYDPSDPYTMILYNQANQIAGKLIGIFANHNTNHALASLLKDFRLAKGMEIEFAGHTKAQGYGFDLLHAPEGVDVDLNLAEFLAASVDAVKDPVLKYLNFNTLTADAGALLARIGYNTLEIGLLFNQPIINEVCEYAFNNNLSLEEALRDVRNNYSYYTDPNTNRRIQKFGELGIAGGNAVSKDKMASNIVSYRKDNTLMMRDDFVREQLEILNLFNQIVVTAGEVNQFVTSTKFTASNAVKSTFGDMYSQQMKVDNYINSMATESALEITLSDHPTMEIQKSPIVNDRTRLQPLESRETYQEYINGVMYNPLGYEQCMFDLNRVAIERMNKYYPYDTPIYKNVRNIMRHLTKSKYLDGDTINSIHRDMLVHLLSLQEQSDFNGEGAIQTRHGVMTNREYYTKYFANDVFEYLEEHPEVKSLPLFDYLILDENPVTGDNTINVQGVGGLAPYQKEALRDSWSELNKINPELSKGLFMFSFYKLGFDFSPMSFMNLAPTDVKQSIKVPGTDSSGNFNENRTYVDFMRQVLEGKIGINYNDFIQQYLLNHTDNKSLVYNVKSKTAKRIVEPLVVNKLTYGYNDSFVLDASTLKDAFDMFVLESDKESKITRFRPALKIGNAIYIAESGGLAFNESTTGTMTYVRYDAVGSKHSKAYSAAGIMQRVERSIQNQQQEQNTQEQQEQPQPMESQPEPGNTSVLPEQLAHPENFSREDVMDAMAEELLKGFQRIGLDSLEDGSPMTVKFIKDMILNPLDDSDLMAQVEIIRKACRENNIIMLDEEGNPMQGC